MKDLDQRLKENILSIAMSQIANDPKQVEMWVDQFKSIIRQREKDLLARVREEVIGEVSYLEDALITNLKQKQLKKLEIISKEGK